MSDAEHLNLQVWPAGTQCTLPTDEEICELAEKKEKNVVRRKKKFLMRRQNSSNKQSNCPDVPRGTAVQFGTLLKEAIFGAAGAGMGCYLLKE